MRGPEPTLSDRSMGIDRALEYNLLVSVRRREARRKMSASDVEDETNSLTADGPVISVSCSRGGDRKVTPSPRASNSMLCMSATGPRSSSYPQD